MDSPLRILHVVVNMNRGGAETLIMNLYRHIDRSKVQFDFLTCKPGAFDKEIMEMGGVVHRIPYVTDVGHFKYTRLLGDFFKLNPYHIVHSHMDKMSGAVLRNAKKYGVPVRLAHSHNTESEGNSIIRLYKWWNGMNIGRSATKFIACSTDAAEWLFHRKAAKAQIVKNGIVPSQFTYSNETRTRIRGELGLAEHSFVIGHVGRFAKQKNHEFLIELFAEYEQLNKDAALVMLGDGPIRTEMESKAKELGLARKAKFLGVRQDVEEVMQAFDVFVFPSRHEGLPVTLIEAQGSGLTCIISDAITKEVDLGLGLIDFLPLHDQRIWLNRLVKSQKDINKRGKNHEAFINKGYDITKTAAEIESMYLSFIGESG